MDRPIYLQKKNFSNENYQNKCYQTKYYIFWKKERNVGEIKKNTLFDGKEWIEDNFR